MLWLNKGKKVRWDRRDVLVVKGVDLNVDMYWELHAVALGID